MRDLETTLLNLEKQLMYYRLHDFETFLTEDFIEFGTSGEIYDKNRSQIKLLERLYFT